MPTAHTISSGECLWSLSRTYKVPWKKIWEHADNGDLRDRRGNPNVLLAGDEVVIPDRVEKLVSAGAEQKNSYRAPGKLELSVQLLDFVHQPLAGVEYSFVLDGESTEPATTGGDGLATAEVPRNLRSASLKLPWGTFPVELGSLDPARTVSGMQQRLRNLGIDPGPVDGIMGPRTRRALREFQTVESSGGLTPSGEPDADTIARLRELHDGQTLDGDHNSLENAEAQEDDEAAEEADVAESSADGDGEDDSAAADELTEGADDWVDHFHGAESAWWTAPKEPRQEVDDGDGWFESDLDSSRE